jgi:hypothetical protein
MCNDGFSAIIMLGMNSEEVFSYCLEITEVEVNAVTRVTRD